MTNCFRPGLRILILATTLGWLAAGCADDRAAPEPAPTVKSPRADKPLKLFPEEKSAAWRLAEAKIAAEARAKAYRGRHSEQARPTSPDPMRGIAFRVAEATAGLAGGGALIATIETSVGNIRCVLDEKEGAHATAHFVGLARGTRTWWDATLGRWSTDRYYQGSPFFKITPGQAAFAGCPTVNGTGDIGFRSVVDPKSRPQLKGDKNLAMVVTRIGRSMGPQFVLLAKNPPEIDELVEPFGACTDDGAIDRLVGLVLTDTGRPVDDVIVSDIVISRGPR